MIINNVVQIRSKQAFIINNWIGVSYNTPIAAKTAGVTFITSRYYSNTTAHHKTGIIRVFNTSEVIEVKPETLTGIITGSINPEEVKKEAATKDEILESLETRNPHNKTLLHHRINRTIKPAAPPTKKHYKNGNKDTVYYLKTNFQHLENVTYQKKVKSIPTTVIKDGKQYSYHKHKYSIQKIRS